MKERKLGYDLVRIISILMVVAIHSNVAYLSGEQGTAGWYFVMLLTSVCLVSVPLFFMVSGALLLDTEEVISLKPLFFKRILKQAIPFLVWSVIYVVVRIINNKIPFTLSAFTDVLHTPAYYQFWFMYSLLAIYLLLPVLQAIVIKLEKKHVEYLLILWAIFSIIVPVLQRFIPKLKLSEHADLVICEGYIGYFLLGYYLKKYHSLVSCKKALFFGLIGIMITAIFAVLEYVVCAKNGTIYIGYFYKTYLTPFVVLAVVGLFLFFQNAKYTDKEKPIKLLNTGSNLSIGVFYVHMLVLTLLEYLGFTGENNVLIVLLKIVSVYGVSVLISLIISKIPFVKKILMGL